MKIADILLWVVGLAAAGFAVYEFMKFASAKDPVTGTQDIWAGTDHLWMAVAAAVIASVCVVMAFVRRPRAVEEIHITK